MGSENTAINYLSPDAAWRMMQEDPNAILVDVRSDMEYLMIGHPKMAVNVPWIDAPDWTVNPEFIPCVRKLLLGRLSGMARQQAAVILICRSGNRSKDAAETLCEAGFSDLYVIEGGFEGPLNEHHHRNAVAGWRFCDLPWEQC